MSQIKNIDGQRSKAQNKLDVRLHNEKDTMIQGMRVHPQKEHPQFKSKGLNKHEWDKIV